MNEFAKGILNDALAIANIAVSIAAPGATQIVMIASGTIQRIADNHGLTYDETLMRANEAEATFFKNNEQRRQELLDKHPETPS